MSEFLFTSESVTEGHPDKVCDKISDAVVDDVLSHDPNARIACETVCNTGMIMLMGELSTTHFCHFASLARDTLREIGYDGSGGFSASNCAVLVGVEEQSPDIAQGVSLSREAREGSDDPLDAQGAGDQGMMFGYACTESEAVEEGTYMPLPIHLAHGLAARLAEVRKDNVLPNLLPDGKTQVTVRYEDMKPQQVGTVLISTQHQPEYSQEQIRNDLYEHVVQPVIPAALCRDGVHGNVRFITNPTGTFIKGGPEADSGLTGRKIIVDTYGGWGRHGGGAFSGKDPSKVDRSAAYYTRYVAKNLVAAGAAERLELQVSYAIGFAQPTSLSVETFGTHKVEPSRIEQMLRESGLFDFRPLAIISALDLLKTRYSVLAAYGHFGRSSSEAPWERHDKVDAVRQALGI